MSNIQKNYDIAKAIPVKDIVVEEMVNHSYRGILCKICESDYFGVLFRLAHKTNKTSYGCHKCIVQILENLISSKSSPVYFDDKKIYQDIINYVKPDIYK